MLLLVGRLGYSRRMWRGLTLMLAHLLFTPLLSVAALLLDLLFPHREMTARCARVWGSLMCRAGGAKVRLFGSDNWLTGPAILAANHASAFDVYALMSLMPFPYRFVAKQELFRIPVFGWALRRGGHVALARSGSARDVRVLRQLESAIASHALFLFFPEGERTTDGRLIPFKLGAFHFAIQNQLPVIPVAIRGAQRVQPYPSWRVQPGLIDVEVLPAIPCSGLDRQQLMERTFEALARALPPDQRPAER